MRTLLGCVLTLTFCCVALAEDKKGEKFDAKLLVGKWEPKEKEKEDGAPTGVEFVKDGKVLLTHSVKGKEFTNEARYKLDGDKLTLTIKIADKEIALPVTVLKLTDTVLTTKNDKGEEKTLVRVKDKK